MRQEIEEKLKAQTTALNSVQEKQKALEELQKTTEAKLKAQEGENTSEKEKIAALAKAKDETEKRMVAEKDAASQKAAREITEKASQQLAADEAQKRGNIQSELVGEHKAHANVAERLVKETSTKIDLAKRLVNAEATSIERFDAAKELDKELGVAETLKNELSKKTHEVNLAKSVLHDIASQPVIKPEQVNMKVTDPSGNTLEITAKKHADSVKIAEPKKEQPATLAKEEKHSEKQLAKVPSLTKMPCDDLTVIKQDSVPVEE